MITWVNILAVLNKQVGRQAIKKIVFLLCLESLTRCIIVLDSYELNRQISALDPISSNSINYRFELVQGYRISISCSAILLRQSL
ncbi:MAG: hypothetical protein EZS28_042469, partial [Streblomastix strix]